MELVNAIQTMTATMATTIVWGLGITMGCVVLYIFVMDYLRARAAANRRMWRDL